MKNRRFDLLPISMKSVEEDEFEFERVIKLVEEWGIKESACGLKLSQEKVIQNVLEYIKNVIPRIEYLQEMLDQESRWMVNKGERGSELQKSPHLKTSHVEGGDESVDVQETGTSRVVGNREIVLLGSTKLVEIIGHRENELEQMIKVVEMMGIKAAGRLIGQEDLEVIDKVKEYIRLKRSQVEFLKKSVQESNVMTEKLKNVQESELHLKLKTLNEEKKGGDESVHVQKRNEREKERVSATNGGMSSVVMQMGGEGYGKGPGNGNFQGQHKQKNAMMQVQQSVYDREYPPLPGRSTGQQQQVNVKESNEKYGEPKSSRELHLKSLNSEKEEGDESVDNKREDELSQESIDEKVGDGFVHAEARNERGSEEVTGGGMSTIGREVGDSMQVLGRGHGRGRSRGQQLHRSMIGCNCGGSECKGWGRAHVVRLQQKVYTTEYPPLQGHSRGQHQQQPGVQGRGWGRGLSRGQKPQSAVRSQDLPAPGSVHGGFASYINNPLVAPNHQTQRRGGN